MLRIQSDLFERGEMLPLCSGVKPGVGTHVILALLCNKESIHPSAEGERVAPGQLTTQTPYIEKKKCKCDYLSLFGKHRHN